MERVTSLYQRVPLPARILIEVVRTKRLAGLAAESAFWITFTLPWIALGVLASVGWVASRTNPQLVVALEQAVLDASARVLTPEAVNQFLKPLLDQLAEGRADLGVIGVLIALWSGSRMVAALTDAVAVIHGAPGFNGYARNRGLGVAIYLIGLVATAVAVALMAVGLDRVASLLGLEGLAPLLAYAVMGALIYGLLVLLLRVPAPERGPVRNDLVGAGVALAGWVVGSIGLHFYTDRIFGEFSVYTAVAAPIAILLWSYITAIAVLLGAAVCVVLDQLTSSSTAEGSPEQPLIAPPGGGSAPTLNA